MTRIVRVPLAVLLLGSAGCATLQPVREPALFIERANSPVVYVTFKNHSKVTLTQPQVRGDSLFGTVPGVSHRLVAPLSHVDRIEAKQRDQTRTRWLIAGVSALTAAGLVAMTLGGSGEMDCDATYYRSECYNP